MSEQRYGCKTCRKEVEPFNGRLICCGHTFCLRCRLNVGGYSDDYFISKCRCADRDAEQAMYDEVDHDEY